MRKSVSIPIIVVFAFCAWLLLGHTKSPQPNQVVAQSTTHPVQFSQIVLNTPTNAALPQTVVASTPVLDTVPAKNNVPLLNLLDSHNLEQWKTVVTNLGHTTENSWVMMQSYSNSGLPFIISSLPFNADAVSVFTSRNDGNHVRRIELQSPMMTVADTRALGDLLLGMMGKDNADFNAWCDKAGNNYGYSPLFDSGNAHLPDGKVYGFSILCGFNGVKPWIINFIITDP